jgi:2-polyprenyl-6-methoxyphenol hydroxylase-like FAD-dependent oxidoreductase
VIPKGGIDRVKANGIDAFRQRVIALSPFLADRVGELKSFDDVKLLSVMVNRLRQWWRPGLICIGDAAHAMSPIGGVGINIAVQDAVAAANCLAVPLKSGTTTGGHLQAVQARRDFPARMTQKIQLTMQNRIIGPALQSTRAPKPPLLFKLFDAFPILRRIPARLLALGIQPEHVQTPDAGTSG